MQEERAECLGTGPRTSRPRRPGPLTESPCPKPRPLRRRLQRARATRSVPCRLPTASRELARRPGRSAAPARRPPSAPAAAASTASAASPPPAPCTKRAAARGPARPRHGPERDDSCTVAVRRATPAAGPSAIEYLDCDRQSRQRIADGDRPLELRRLRVLRPDHVTVAVCSTSGAGYAHTPRTAWGTSTAMATRPTGCTDADQRLQLRHLRVRSAMAGQRGRGGVLARRRLRIQRRAHPSALGGTSTLDCDGNRANVVRKQPVGRLHVQGRAWEPLVWRPSPATRDRPARTPAFATYDLRARTQNRSARCSAGGGEGRRPRSRRARGRGRTR